MFKKVLVILAIALSLSVVTTGCHRHHGGPGGGPQSGQYGGPGGGGPR